MSDKTPSLTDELTRERNREAADCTLLAWVRPSLAMISLGFGIERLGQASMASIARSAVTRGLPRRIFPGVASLSGAKTRAAERLSLTP